MYRYKKNVIKSKCYNCCCSYRIYGELKDYKFKDNYDELICPECYYSTKLVHYHNRELFILDVIYKKRRRYFIIKIFRALNKSRAFIILKFKKPDNDGYYALKDFIKMLPKKFKLEDKIIMEVLLKYKRLKVEYCKETHHFWELLGFIKKGEYLFIN